MNSEYKFWVSFWSLTSVVIISITITIGLYYTNKNTKIVEAIKSGADPIAVVCALDNNEAHSQICTILAAKK